MPRKKSQPRQDQPVSEAQEVLARLECLGSEKVRSSLARYAIPAEKAWGIPVGVLRKEARRLGKRHILAKELWQSGWYEARMLAVFLADPQQVTPALMDRWCADFDSWAICDTACFHLFDRTPYAETKIIQWARRKEEFVRRAAFALMASVALHDKKREEAVLASWLPLIQRVAKDERNFVKKGVSWALRGIGRRSPALFNQAMNLAQSLAASADANERWIGKDAMRDLAKVASRSSRLNKK